ncbi:MAG: molecular chaperone HtpG [Clostridia bacterium]|nr:molecular chaperone HtpG [Clostridia bacterium]
MAQKGTISIQAENIMPVIKRWLYSDKDIFLREIVSNACDAIAKHRVLALNGEAEPEENYRVDVVADEKEGTIKVVDNGVGMTGDEVIKYIAQVAFSGAEDFLKKYKPEQDESSGIIGHFGLGFYSAFMVSKKVVIDTLSYQDGATPVRWESDDGMTYEMSDSNRQVRGTTITLYINEEDHEFLHLYTLRQTLEKYCAFMPVEIYLSEIKPPEEKKEGEEDEKPAEPEKINEIHPLWTKKPSDCTEEEYKEFYRDVFHDFEEPLFWIHLNAEYPFNLKGILYFPKLKNEFTSNEGVIKLYNNQVFVADNIKEVIPEFLMLLKGVIDCPDLPLNVSRSFLQNDGYVRKMQAYITRKVADRLVSEFTNRREEYEKYWDDIHPFVKYGCIRDDKFFDKVKPALIIKTVGGKGKTISEYVADNCDADKEEKTIYYSSDEKRQAHLIEMYTSQGKDVAIFDTLIDNNFLSFMEYSQFDKDMKLRFMRVDAGVDGLTDDVQADEDARKSLEEKFRKALGNEELTVELKSFKTDSVPAMITVEEQSRRFADISKTWGSRGFEMPVKRTLALNSRHPLIAHLQKNNSDELDEMICRQIDDLAEMARSPLESGRMVAFLERSNQLLTRLVENNQN